MAVLEFEQITLGTSDVETLTVPAGTHFAELQASGANVRYTLDGQDPTTTFGMLLIDGAAPTVLGCNLGDFKCIGASGTPKLNVHYHGHPEPEEE